MGGIVFPPPPFGCGCLPLPPCGGAFVLLKKLNTVNTMSDEATVTFFFSRICCFVQVDMSNLSFFFPFFPGLCTEML